MKKMDCIVQLRFDSKPDRRLSSSALTCAIEVSKSLFSTPSPSEIFVSARLSLRTLSLKIVIFIIVLSS